MNAAADIRDYEPRYATVQKSWHRAFRAFAGGSRECTPDIHEYEHAYEHSGGQRNIYPLNGFYFEREAREPPTTSGPGARAFREKMPASDAAQRWNNTTLRGCRRQRSPSDL